MGTLGAIGFTAPWLLWGLLALPILWILLRAVPPAPIRRRFPGVALLLGLDDRHQQTDRTPWWLLLLRMLAVAAVMLAMLVRPRTADVAPAPLTEIRSPVSTRIRRRSASTLQPSASLPRSG